MRSTSIRRAPQRRAAARAAASMPPLRPVGVRRRGGHGAPRRHRVAQPAVVVVEREAGVVEDRLGVGVEHRSRSPIAPSCAVRRAATMRLNATIAGRRARAPSARHARWCRAAAACRRAAARPRPGCRARSPRTPRRRAARRPSSSRLAGLPRGVEVADASARRCRAGSHIRARPRTLRSPASARAGGLDGGRVVARPARDVTPACARSRRRPTRAATPTCAQQRLGLGERRALAAATSADPQVEVGEAREERDPRRRRLGEVARVAGELLDALAEGVRGVEVAADRHRERLRRLGCVAARRAGRGRGGWRARRPSRRSSARPVGTPGRSRRGTRRRAARRRASVSPASASRRRGEGAHRLEQPVPGLVRGEVGDDERLVDERPHQLGDVVGVDLRRPPRGATAASIEKLPPNTPSAPEAGSLVVAEQSIAPLEQPLHGPLALGDRRVCGCAAAGTGRRGPRGPGRARARRVGPQPARARAADRRAAGRSPPMVAAVESSSRDVVASSARPGRGTAAPPATPRRRPPVTALGAGSGSGSTRQIRLGASPSGTRLVASTPQPGTT